MQLCIVILAKYTIKYSNVCVNICKRSECKLCAQSCQVCRHCFLPLNNSFFCTQVDYVIDVLKVRVAS